MENNRLTGKRYIALVRASHATTEENSTTAQLGLLKAFAARQGMIFVDEIVLEGVTGSLPGKRKDLPALIERAKEKHDFDVLLVQRLDRLTRGGSRHGMWFEQECLRVGVELVVAGDGIPEGRFSTVIKTLQYDSAQDQAFSISERSAQGAQLALEDGRNVTSGHTPYACWRLYMTADGKPSHIIRDLRDGRQEQLDPQTYAVTEKYGAVGSSGREHYRKQKSERVLLMPGDKEHVAVVREIFDLHFKNGWGGRRIADHLNKKGIPSPRRKEWSQHQVEVIYEQEAYTGRSVANRTSSAIYHERSPNTPKPVTMNPAMRATAQFVPVRHRPLEEWFHQTHPMMENFLDAEIRQLAMAEHEKLWQRRGDPNRPKLSKSKHRGSDYLLTGLFFAKQDSGPLVGVLCGHKGHPVRYYRHRRQRRGYRKGSIFNRMFAAEPLESAVLIITQEILADLPELRTRIHQFVLNQSKFAGGSAAALAELRERREQVQKRTDLIFGNITDEGTLADARPTLERLKAERRTLDEQIAAAVVAQRAQAINPDEVADRAAAKIAQMAANIKSMPKFALRKLLGMLIERVVGDMETKAVEVTLALPAAVVWEPSEAADAMRLVGSSPSSTGYETHRPLVVVLAYITCQYQYVPGSQAAGCFQCRRLPRAA